MFYLTQVHFSAPSCEMYDVTVNAFIWRIVMHLHPLMSLLKARVLIGLFIACLYSSFLYTATYSVLSTLSTYKCYISCSSSSKKLEQQSVILGHEYHLECLFAVIHRHRNWWGRSGHGLTTFFDLLL